MRGNMFVDEKKQYSDFWNERGLDHIIPPRTNDPEGFDVGDVLEELCTGKIVEIGCGTGRIAKYFDPELYKGFDINRAAVDQARANCPDHAFFHSELQGYFFPKSDVVLLYTVCLHIPDSMILDQLYTAGKGTSKIVIAEIMNPKYRGNRAHGSDYDLSNQRSLAEYEEVMKNIGFVLTTAVRKPYAHYEGEEITFAVFERIYP